MLKLTCKEELQTLLDKDNKIIIIDFYADWCGPCQHIKQPFQQLSIEKQHICSCFSVNVDTSPELSNHCGIKCMPTFQFYHGGIKVGEILGADINSIKTKLEELQNMFDIG